MDFNGDVQTIRFPALSELEVSSYDRYGSQQQDFIDEPTTSSDILFPARQSLLSGYFTRIALSEVQLRWRTPNINTYNNQVLWSSRSNGVASTFSTIVARQFYSAEDLANVVALQMGIAEGDGTLYDADFDPDIGWEITKDVADPINDGYLFFSPSTIFGLNVPNSQAIASFYTTCETPFYQAASFVYDDVHTIIPVGSDLAYTRYIDIVSDKLAQYSKVKDNMTRQNNGQVNVLARVFLTPFGGKELEPYQAPFTMCIDYTTPKYLRWSPGEYINDFDIKLFDDRGRPLYWEEKFSTEYQLNIQASET